MSLNRIDKKIAFEYSEYNIMKKCWASSWAKRSAQLLKYPFFDFNYLIISIKYFSKRQNSLSAHPLTRINIVFIRLIKKLLSAWYYYFDSISSGISGEWTRIQSDWRIFKWREPFSLYEMESSCRWEKYSYGNGIQFSIYCSQLGGC